jgi:hypothetical protein
MLDSGCARKRRYTRPQMTIESNESCFCQDYPAVAETIQKETGKRHLKFVTGGLREVRIVNHKKVPALELSK